MATCDTTIHPFLFLLFGMECKQGGFLHVSPNKTKTKIKIKIKLDFLAPRKTSYIMKRESPKKLKDKEREENKCKSNEMWHKKK